MTPPEVQASVIELARTMFADLAAGFGEADGTCFYWALAVQLALAKHGIKATPQAGSAAWRRAADDVDDGRPAVFSYEWDDDVDDADIDRQLEAGCLPEMHVWILIVDTDELVDLSTPSLPAVVESVGGVQWLMPSPPMVWAVDPTTQIDCAYAATPKASRLAARLMVDHLTARIADVLRR